MKGTKLYFTKEVHGGWRIGSFPCVLPVWDWFKLGAWFAQMYSPSVRASDLNAAVLPCAKAWSFCTSSAAETLTSPDLP